MQDIDLTLRQGQFSFLIGPSGAGKTSLLRLLGLSHPASKGTVNLFGQDLAVATRAQIAHLRRRIGVVFQDFRLLDHLSAFDNIALPLRINGADEEQIHAFVADMMDWLGLSHLTDTLPPAMSMGQRQLIAVSRAVVIRPALLLCDEPTSNIDGDRATRVMHLLVQLNKLGTTVILATHSLDLQQRYAYGTIRMDRGRMCSA
ncbi:MAG: cell division ATP-binding protein FtsE [Geminicoccaceae bacterium]